MKIMRIGFAAAAVVLGVGSPAHAQLCSPASGRPETVGFVPGSAAHPRPANCLNLFRCYQAELESPTFEIVGSCDPTVVGANCTVRATVPSTLPGNSQNPSASTSYVRAFWFDSMNAAVGSCGAGTGVLNFWDEGGFTLQLGGFSCDLTTFGDVYRLDVRTCLGATGCTMPTATTPIDLTLAGLGRLFCDPPRDTCNNCGACPVPTAALPAAAAAVRRGHRANASVAATVAVWAPA